MPALLYGFFFVFALSYSHISLQRLGRSQHSLTVSTWTELFNLSILSKETVAVGYQNLNDALIILLNYSQLIKAYQLHWNSRGFKAVGSDIRKTRAIDSPPKKQTIQWYSRKTNKSLYELLWWALNLIRIGLPKYLLLTFAIYAMLVALCLPSRGQCIQSYLSITEIHIWLPINNQTFSIVVITNLINKSAKACLEHWNTTATKWNITAVISKRSYVMNQNRLFIAVLRGFFLLKTDF